MTGTTSTRAAEAWRDHARASYAAGAPERLGERTAAEQEALRDDQAA